MGVIHHDEEFYRGFFERREDGRDVYLLFRAGVSMGLSLEDQWLEYGEDVAKREGRPSGIDIIYLNAARGQPTKLVEIPVNPIVCESRRFLATKR